MVTFPNPKEILFPKICVVCGAATENQYKKAIIGRFKAALDYKEDYSLNIPICIECLNNSKIASGYSSKSGKLLLFSSFIGLALGISLFFVIYSIFLSISLITISIVLPYLNYKAKTRKKIKIDNFLKVRLSVDGNSLTFDFFNANFARFVNEINTQMESEEDFQQIE